MSRKKDTIVANDKLKKEMGLRLKVLRKERCLTQQQMADALRISLTAYQNYERGERFVPAKIVDRITETGVATEWLFEGRGDIYGQEATNEPIQEYKTDYPEIDIVIEVNRILDSFEKHKNKRRAIQEIYSLIMSQTSPRPGGDSRITGDKNVQTVGDGNVVEKK